MALIKLMWDAIKWVFVLAIGLIIIVMPFDKGAGLIPIIAMYWAYKKIKAIPTQSATAIKDDKPDKQISDNKGEWLKDIIREVAVISHEAIKEREAKAGVECQKQLQKS